MEPLTIETFNPDMIKAINSEQKRAGEINYTSVKLSYDGGKVPLLRIDGKFRLFRFKNPRGDIYSLSIKYSLNLFPLAPFFLQIIGLC